MEVYLGKKAETITILIPSYIQGLQTIRTLQ